MPLPSPRTPADDDPSVLADPRAIFLTACAHMWDHTRAASRAHMSHGATMILNKLGGTLVLRAESTVSKRTIPEAGFISEGFQDLRDG